jgi:hypothetical protein
MAIKNTIGARHFATRTHVTVLQCEDKKVGLQYTGILMYDFDDEHEEQITSVDFCPKCKDPLPKEIKKHLKCGWGID